jgi:hypothetical protein
VNVEGVDLIVRRPPQRPCHGARADNNGGVFPLFRGQSFRVSEDFRGEIGRKNAGRGSDRTGDRSPSRLVDPAYEIRGRFSPLFGRSSPP